MKMNVPVKASLSLIAASALVFACGHSQKISRSIGNAPDAPAIDTQQTPDDTSPKLEVKPEIQTTTVNVGASGTVSSGNGTADPRPLNSPSSGVGTPPVANLPEDQLKTLQATGPASDFSPNFCVGLQKGECFTLVVQIPSGALEQNAGLTSLNIARYSESYRGLLQQKCSEGLTVGLPKLNNTLPLWLHDPANKIFTNVKKARCVFQTILTEGEPAPQLDANEMGLRVRLFDFELSGRATSTKPAFGKIEFASTTLSSGFYDVYAFGVDSTGHRGWLPVPGGWSLGRNDGVLRQAKFDIKFNRTMAFTADADGALGYLNHALSPVLEAARSAHNVGELGQFGLELTAAKSAVAAIAAGSNPVVPALVLLGIGVNAIKDLCTFEKSDCKIRQTESDLRDFIATSFVTGSPISSETKANFVDGIKTLPLGVVEAVLWHADNKTLVNQMQGLQP